MKKAKSIIVATITALYALGIIVFASCSSTSSKCSSVVCLNGGSCSNGSCTCPSGFNGSDCSSPAESSISYTNNTHTPVSMAANGGSPTTLAVGATVTYQGLYGNPLDVVASTSGMGTTTATVVGTYFNWNLSKTFPQNGTVNYSIDIDSTYFYLYLQNNSAAYSAQGVFVDYGKPARETFDNVSIPNNGTVYGIGYYKAYDSIEIYVNSTIGSGGTFWDTLVYIAPVTFTQNQALTYTFQ